MLRRMTQTQGQSEPSAAAPLEYIGERLADLRAEFPGWVIEGGDMPFASFRAVREGALGSMVLGAGSCGGLRMLLDEVDAVDCGRAVLALRDALHVRGVTAKAQGLTLAAKTRAGILRTVHARRGVFSWASGTELGPIGDITGAADRMMPVLGLGAGR